LVEVASVGEVQPLKNSSWVAMSASGFDTPELALAFGQRMKLSVQLIAARNRLGADCGAEKTLATLGNVFRDEIFKQHGVWVRNSVHGLDVFEDHERVQFASGSVFMQTSIDKASFFNEVMKHYPHVGTLTPMAQKILLLLNVALMTGEPVSQAVFAISAVEMIGQEESWNKPQLLAIQRLAKLAKEDETLTVEEANEIAGAIERGLHKVSLRQGVLRLLKRLNLSHLKTDWDALYGERSAVVHGLAPEAGKSYDGLAFKAITLCGHILMTALSEEVPAISTSIEQLYPIQFLRK
jgi:hypothetical protein